ncbi:MAG: hypothetical protein IPN75_18340 [Dechloromonas sp.]|uniref:Helicase/UvrB N-terminal domain-containing protein n=1 Tax=Candidatus Dechloromonas phosphorivorans TaxID=2899244 RepID=A0A9D7LVX2_9RHOO|nr:hypothetical protein [Candidatus Dechloromonas phosphorivorans]
MLHPHQLDSVWRIVQSGNTGLFHVVGAGKTAVCVIASMELRRLGFASKPCHVVPNHMLAQYKGGIRLTSYSNASVLMAIKEDLKATAGASWCTRTPRAIGTRWSSRTRAERIRMSPRFGERFIKETHPYEIEMPVRAEEEQRPVQPIVKQLGGDEEELGGAYGKRSADQKKDDLLSWELLGIDAPFVGRSPPAQELYRSTKMTRVAGPLHQFGARLRSVPEDVLHDAAHGHAQRGWYSRQRRR